MICHLLKRHLQLGFLFRIALGFLDRTVSSAMGCFIGCFRVRDDRRLPSSTNLVSSSSLPKQKEAAISRNDLSSLFLAEEREDSPSKHGESLGSPASEKGLKDEAKFLKACGTLTETPVEIRKVSEKLKFSPANGRESEPSKFHSWLPNTSVEKHPPDFKLHQPQAPVNVSDKWGTASDASERTPSSCISSAQNDGRFSTETNEGSGTGSSYTAKKANANQSEKVDTPVPCRTKSVRFDCETDMSTSGSSSGGFSRSTRNTGTSGNQSANNPFLYPTPQKLSDVMQTPGTVFPAALENLPNCKPRVRSQFVYAVHSSVEGDSHWKLLQEEDLYSEKYSGETIRSLEQPQSRTPKSDETGSKGISSGTELQQEGSLTDWFKPRVPMMENSPNISNRNLRPPKTPADRPIIGIVATHWNEEETSRVTPKWWDGNGIPNSTTKYKEDQKVSWHATPFEERLEKALSEDTLISRNDSHGKLIAFDENEESDTALSQLQASTQPKSVVSF